MKADHIPQCIKVVVHVQGIARHREDKCVKKIAQKDIPGCRLLVSISSKDRISADGCHLLRFCVLLLRRQKKKNTGGPLETILLLAPSEPSRQSSTVRGLAFHGTQLNAVQHPFRGRKCGVGCMTILSLGCMLLDCGPCYHRNQRSLSLKQMLGPVRKQDIIRRNGQTPKVLTRQRNTIRC